MRKTSSILFLAASASFFSAANATNTYINLTGTATPNYFSGLPQTPVDFTATIQYDISLLNFTTNGNSGVYSMGSIFPYTWPTPVPNPSIGSITIKTALGSQVEAFYGVEVAFSSYGGIPASIFGPGKPPNYYYHATFQSNNYSFFVNNLAETTTPFSTTTPSWLPTAAEPSLALISGEKATLQANISFAQNSSQSNYYYLQTKGFSIGSDVSPVPEPATYGMLIGGLVLIGLVMSRRRSTL